MEIFMFYVWIGIVISSVYYVFKTVNNIFLIIINIYCSLRYKTNKRVKHIDEMTILAKAANEFNFDLYNKMTTKDLKNRFRIKVKKVHPDCGGNSEEFIRVKKAYDILLPYTTI